MSVEYDLYLGQHIDNVVKGYYWMTEHLPNIAVRLDSACSIAGLMNAEHFLRQHDQSKFTPEEYGPYDAYFYGNNKSYRIKQRFNKAWLHHIHNNPHHWQHWVLINDDEKTEALVMPYHYTIEMILDWWTFSWRSGNLMEILDWYDQHRDRIMLHSITRATVEETLNQMRTVLEKEEQTA